MMTGRKWRQLKLRRWTVTECWMRKDVLGDVLDRMFWQLSLEEENEELLELMMGLEEKSREETSTIHWVSSMLKFVVNRSMNIVEYKSRKKEKRVEVESLVGNILEGVVSRGSRIIEYKQKIKEKARKCALAQASPLGQKTSAYPSIRK